MLQYQCRLSESDYIDFNLYTLRFNPAYKRSLLLVRLILPAMFLLFTVFNFFSRREDVVALAIVYAVVTLIWEIAVKPLYVFIMLRNIKTQLKHSNSLYEPEYTLIFNDDHILEITPQQESKISYDKIERIAVNMGAVYIYPNSVTAMLLPAPLFPLDADRERLLSFLQARCRDLTVEAKKKK